MRRNGAHRAAVRAQGVGVALATNNHIGGQCETIAGTRAYLDEVNHPNWGLLYDCMHLRSTGQDYIGCIAEFAPATKNILIQSRRPWRQGDEIEFPGNNSGWTPVLPDADGAQDWQAVFAAFQEQGYEGLVTVIESGGLVCTHAHCSPAGRPWASHFILLRQMRTETPGPQSVSQMS